MTEIRLFTLPRVVFTKPVHHVIMVAKSRSENGIVTTNVIYTCPPHVTILRLDIFTSVDKTDFVNKIIESITHIRSIPMFTNTTIVPWNEQDLYYFADWDTSIDYFLKNRENTCCIYFRDTISESRASINRTLKIIAEGYVHNLINRNELCVSTQQLTQFPVYSLVGNIAEMVTIAVWNQRIFETEDEYRDFRKEPNLSKWYYIDTTPLDTSIAANLNKRLDNRACKKNDDE